MRIQYCAALCLLFCLPAAIYGQSNAGWDSVKRIAPGERIRIHDSRRIVVCNFSDADDDGLDCIQHRTVFFVPVRSSQHLRRADIRSIRFSKQGASTLLGTVIGVGAGAGIGAGIDASAKNQVEEGHLATLLFAFLGAAIGTAVGRHTDFLAGPLVYRTP